LTFAACLSGTDYYKIYIHSKRLGEKIVFDVPEKFHPKIFENSFILNFGYPDIDPHPINSYLNKKSTVRLIIDGDGVGNSRADRELDNENKKYSKTEGGVDVYQGEVRNGYSTSYYSFKNKNGATILFEDNGSIATSYYYYDRLSAVDLRGTVSKDIRVNFKKIDYDIGNFVNGLICDGGQ